MAAAHFPQENPHILEKLVNHVDTTSVTEIVKRLVGADEQSSIMFMPTYAQWLADTPLVNLLLNRLGSSHSVEVQTNAADILSAIAHTQPSPLAAKLTRDECIGALFQHALQPGRQVLVAALDVCIALLEPKRSNPDMLADASPLQESARRAKSEAVAAIVNHLPSLVALLQQQDGAVALDTPYGLLSPPLGRAKLKVVELMAVLLRSGDVVAERGLVASNSVPVCLELFRNYPFNNLLHHNITAMLVVGVARPSENLIPYFFEHCKLLDWITTLPTEVRPIPRPGYEMLAAAKPVLRAGYLGHVIQIGSTLEGVASAGIAAPESVNKAAVEVYLSGHTGWQQWLANELHPRQEVGNISKWQCGRPAATDLAGIDSDGDEYQVRIAVCVSLVVEKKRCILSVQYFMGRVQIKDHDYTKSWGVATSAGDLRGCSMIGLLTNCAIHARSATAAYVSWIDAYCSCVLHRLWFHVAATPASSYEECHPVADALAPAFRTKWTLERFRACSQPYTTVTMLWMRGMRTRMRTMTTLVTRARPCSKQRVVTALALRRGVMASAMQQMPT